MPTRFTPTDILSTYAALNALNDNFDSIATLLDLCVMRDGSTPNSMLANLDLNHFNINNVANAVASSDAVNLSQVQSMVLGNLNLGTFRTSANYTNDSAGSSLIIGQGSDSTPVTTQGASVVVQKTSSATVFDSFAAMAFKKSSSTDARATAIFAEASDTAGGITTFIEGIRGQATLISGTNGSAYGGVLVAGTGPSPITPQYLIGVEAVVDDQVGPDAAIYTSFNKDKYKAGVVATCGDFGGTLYKADAGFVTNPYSNKAFRTGMLFTAGSVDHTGIAFQSAVSVVNGIDMSLATISGNALMSPGFTVDATGNVNLGSGKVFKVNGTQVVAARQTGWAADTGTAKKTANATYGAGTTLTFSASYVQAEQTAMATRMAAVELAVQNIAQKQKAIVDALIAHGLIGA